jgi:hypothetical protein
MILAVVRAAGGVALFVHGPKLAGTDRITMETARILGAGLVAVALVAGIASLGCMRRRRWAWMLGFAVLALFILDGALNGLLIYGRPGETGTIVNVLWSGLVVAFLIRGRGALQEGSLVEE